MRGLALIVLLVCTTAVLAVDGPEGVYDCEGTNDGGVDRYRGQVEVTRDGEIYRVVWRFGESSHSGVGLMHGDVFAVSYTAPYERVGVALYTRDGNGWYGRWTEMGAQLVGLESWKKPEGP